MRPIPSIFSFLIFLFVACQRDAVVYSTNTPGGTPVSDIIAFQSLSPVQVTADSATPCEIAVQINPNTDSVDRQVIFTTTNGTFPNGYMSDTIIPAANGLTTTSIVSNTPGPAKIVANLKSFLVDSLIEFIPALPDILVLSALPDTGSLSQTFTLTCQVFRNVNRGKVSDPVTISFLQQAVTAPGQGLVFLPSVTTASGKATLSVTNPYQSTGTFVLIANTPAANGATLTASVALIIK